MNFEYRTTVKMFLGLGCVVIVLAGCPDYSHQAPVPNYSIMTDTGVSEGNTSDEYE